MRRVVVAGSGQVGVLAAIALKRALPPCEIVVVDLPLGPASFADRAASSLPFSNLLHDRLGIEEAQLVARAGASHRLATRYIGWGGAQQHGMLTHGAQSEAEAQTRFMRDWGGGGARNVTGERPPGSLAQVLAEAGRFAVPPDDQPSPLAEIDYALRWNPPAYRGMLIKQAQRLGIAHAPGPVAAIEPDGKGGLAAIILEGQRRIEADLFVDCSGPSAILRSALPEVELADWSAMLPVRRVMLARPGNAMLALEDRVSLVPEGWLTELAGRDGLQVALGIGERTGDEAAVRALGEQPAEVVPVSPGCMRDPWSGNVVALGDAAAQFEPLGNLNLDCAHRQIDLLLEMLPGRDIVPLERAEYNRRAQLMFDGVCHTLALHYAAPRAREVFGEIATPDAVTIALDQFRRRGRLPFQEEDPLGKQEKVALLLALGFEQGLPPQRAAIRPEEIEAARSAFDAKARAALEFTPPYDQWMASVLRG
tara:strand:- start:5 stop:1444 length:1440 start_codon:yes stop_codon:yes gene_type:complete